MNIIQMSEFEKSRNGLNRQEAVGLLRECREVAFRRLSTAMLRMLGKVDDTLFEWSEKAEHRPDQSFYFDAMRELRLKRTSIEVAFKAKFMEGFNREIRRESSEGKDNILAEQMSLVDDAGLEESLAVKNMVNKIETECRHELHHLNRRIGVLLNVPELASANNPLGPDVICNAFRDACVDVESGIKVKLIIMKLFDRYIVDEELESLYNELNGILVGKGILPELRHEVKRHPRKSSAEDDADADDQDEENLYDTLKQLMLRGGVASTVANAVVISNFIGSLTRLQQGQIESVAGGVDLDKSALESGTVNVIRNIKASDLAGSMGSVEGMVIDVIAMLFDYVFDDADIPDTMKALIGRLQIPMLKVGMLDKEFFSRRSHPARRLLNTLAKASIGWNAELDQALYKKIEGVVQEIIEGFDKEIGLFTRLLEDFEQYLAKEREKAEHHEDQSTRLVQGTERLRLAKQRVRMEVEKRNKATLPKFVRNFLLSYWQNLLLVTFVKEGEDSIAWKRGLTAMDNLVWSLQPKATILERDRLVKLLPSLLRVLREGMSLISMREDDFQTFLGQLARYHAGVVNAVPRNRNAANDGDEVPIMIDDPLAEIDDDEPVFEDKRIATATVNRLVRDGDLQAEETNLGDESDEPEEVVDDEFVVQAREIKHGTWIEFDCTGETPLRAKLTWVSPVTGIYLFTNRQGLKTCDKTLHGLAAELRNGNARILVDAPLFERAVHSVVDDLRKQAVG